MGLLEKAGNIQAEDKSVKTVKAEKEAEKFNEKVAKAAVVEEPKTKKMEQS